MLKTPTTVTSLTWSKISIQILQLHVPRYNELKPYFLDEFLEDKTILKQISWFKE